MELELPGFGAVGNNNIGVAGMVWDADLTLYAYGDGDSVAYEIIRFEQILQDAKAAQQHILTTSAPIGQARDTLIVRRIRDALTNYLSDPKNVFIHAISQDSALASGIAVAVADIRSGVFIRTTALDQAVAQLLVTPMANQIITVAGADYYGTQPSPGTDVWMGGTTIVAPSEHVLTLARSTDSSGVHVEFGNSFAAPFVAGVAAQLIAMDPTLTGAEIKSYAVRGAHLSRWDTAGFLQPSLAVADTAYLLNAYGSLTLLAQERPGAPICGNRIWASGKTVFAQRIPGQSPQTLLTLQDTVGELNPYHGGRRIDLLVNGIGYESIRHTAGGWVLDSIAPPDIPALSSGTWKSTYGVGHEGDSILTVNGTPQPTANLTITVARFATTSPYGGRTVGTISFQLQAPGKDFWRRTAVHDTSGAFTGWNYAPGDSTLLVGNYETIAFNRGSVHPRNDSLFVALYKNQFTDQGPSAWQQCQGATRDSQGNWSCEFRTANYTSQVVRSELYAFPSTGTPAAGTLKQTMNSLAMYWLGFSENGSEVVAAIGEQNMSTISNCWVKYLNPFTWATRDSVASPTACRFHDVAGGLAPVSGYRSRRR